MKHTILGAGPVGRAAAESLSARNQEVTLVSRSVPFGLPKGVRHLAVDVADSAALASACAGSGVVYQCLGAPYHRWAEQFPSLQQASVRLAKALAARLVSFENVYAYGQPGPKPFHEASELAPCSAKGRVRAEMIAQLEETRRRGELDILHVRASDLFGPRMTGSALGEEVIGRAARGLQPRTLGNLDAQHTWTFTRDAGETLALAGLSPTSTVPVLHVPSTEPRSQREVIRALAKLFERELHPSVTPAWVLKLVAIFRPEAGELVEMLYEFEQPFVVDNALTRRQLAQSPTEFDAALRETVAWFTTQSPARKAA